MTDLHRPIVGISAYAARAQWGAWDSDAVLLPRSYVTGETLHVTGGSSK